MTRIPDPTRLPEPTRELIESRGDLNVYRALAHAGSGFDGWMAAGRDLLTSPVLATRLREIVILRVGHLLHADYEIAQHTPAAERAGVTATQRDALAHEQTGADAGFGDTCFRDAGFSPAERAALALTDDLVTTMDTSDEHVATARGLLGDEALLEVLHVIARWAGLALMLRALDVDIDHDAGFVAPH